MPKPSTKSSAKKTKNSNRRESDGRESEGGWVTARFEIPNASGLHARAAAVFVKVAKPFAAEIEIAKEGQIVNGKSILAVLMLGAEKGQTIEIRAKGLQAQQALTSLGELILAGFNE